MVRSWVTIGVVFFPRVCMSVCFFCSKCKVYLVETDEMGKATCADGVEKTESADSINIGCVLGHVERDLDVGLGTQVVDLCREDLGDDMDQAGRVCQVAMVETHLWIY
jgi:hypothetical protein